MALQTGVSLENLTFTDGGSGGFISLRASFTLRISSTYTNYQDIDNWVRGRNILSTSTNRIYEIGLNIFEGQRWLGNYFGETNIFGSSISSFYDGTDIIFSIRANSGGFVDRNRIETLFQTGGSILVEPFLRKRINGGNNPATGEPNGYLTLGSQDFRFESQTSNLVRVNTITPQTYTVGTADSFQFPSNIFSGGTTPYTYSIVGSLPSGITFNASTRTFNIGTGTTAGSYSITIQATDSSSPAQTATATWSITINEAPPPDPDPEPEPDPLSVVNIIPNQTFDSGIEHTFQIPSNIFSGGMTPYTYTADTADGLNPGTYIPLFNGITFDSATRTFTIPNSSRGGQEYRIRVTATDSSSPKQTASAEFTLTIRERVIQPITVQSRIPDKTVYTNRPESFIINVNTFTGGTEPYTWSASSDIGDGTLSPLPTGLTFNSTTREFTASGIASGVYQIRVTVADSTVDGTRTDTRFGNDIFTLTVIDSTPTLTTPQIDRTFDTPGNFTFTYSGVFNNPVPSTSLTYRAEEGYAWLSFNPITRTFTIIDAPEGTYSVNVYVSNGILESQPDTFLINIIEPNTAPAVVGGINSLALFANEVRTIDISGVFFDSQTPRVGELTYTLQRQDGTTAPSQVSVVITSLTQVAINIQSLPVGLYNLRIRATDPDGQSSAWVNFTLTSNPVPNRPPVVANPLEENNAFPKTYDTGQVNILTIPAGTFSDPDNHALTLSAEIGRLGTQYWSFSGRSLTTQSNAPVGSYLVRIRATDTQGSSVVDSFIMTLNNPPPPLVGITPLFNIPDFNITDEEIFSYQVPFLSSFTDDLSRVLTYTLTRNDGSAIPTSGNIRYDPITQILTFTSAPIGRYGFTATARASAGIGNVSTQDFFINVVDAGDEPDTPVVEPDDEFVSSGGFDTVPDGSEMRITQRHTAGDDTLFYQSTFDGGLGRYISFDSHTKVYKIVELGQQLKINPPLVEDIEPGVVNLTPDLRCFYQSMQDTSSNYTENIIMRTTIRLVEDVR